jgi:hypothetical protein
LFFFILSSYFNVEMIAVENEWSLYYDVLLDFSNISSLNKYKTYTLKTRESSDKNNQNKLL